MRPSPDGLELDVDGEVPLPRTVRDAVLVRTAGLSDGARAAAELAAAAGPRFDLGLVADDETEDGVAELLGWGLIVETEPGRAAFRHPLVREALYEDTPWLRRRGLHRRLAEKLAREDGDSAEIAGHWIAAREPIRALDALVDAIAERAAVHAYRDATNLGRRALDLWPEGERGPRAHRGAGGARALCRAGRRAGRGRARPARGRRGPAGGGAGRALADAERRMASIYALQGDRERALAARRVAAEAYAANGLPGEAASERLVMAGFLQSAGLHAEASAAAALARARGRAGRARRPAGARDGPGRRGAREGRRVRGGYRDDPRRPVAGARARADPRGGRGLPAPGTAREIAGDYGGARDALDTALGLCELSGQGPLEQVCLSCMAYVLRELGDWAQVEDSVPHPHRPGRPAPGHAGRRRRARLPPRLARRGRQAAARC